MKKNLLIIVNLTFFLVFSFSCTDENNSNIKKVSRTIIVYMIADNNLSEDALQNINQMENGYSETGANLIVFVDPANASPYLLKIEKGGSRKIKTYSEFNSVDKNEMRKILNEIIIMYPSKEFGLILWSHGSNWMPANAALKSAREKSFGEKSGNRMNIPDLAAALPIKFNFILFDACLMGSIEVAFELREKTDYIIASSTEILADGFPYTEIIPEIIQPTINLKLVAQKYFEHYNIQEGEYRSATITLIDTKQLYDLSLEMNNLFVENDLNINSFDRKTVQRLDTYDEQYVFDLLDFVNIAFPITDKQHFKDCLEKVVLYKSSTPMFISLFEIKAYCGLSCYLPVSEWSNLNSYYKGLEWYKLSGINKLFKN